ncbi:MAG: glycosyltransferase family 2 protein [Bacteroidota bacterium]
MDVSVVIPVFNAAAFVDKAVQSALAQPQTQEVLLIEDGSTDDSLARCQSLAERHEKVRLLRHPSGQNRGAGASRNLGLDHASCDYIAFLDADDFYLAHRFQQAALVLAQHPKADGVYEAIGVHYYEPQQKALFEQQFGPHHLTSLSEEVPPDALFETLLRGDKGWFSLDGLVVKKELIEATGRFDEELRQGQDTDYILRLSLQGQLHPGSIWEAVAMRGVHGANRIFDAASRRASKVLFYEKWFFRMLDNRWNARVNRLILQKYIGFRPLFDRWQQYPFFSRMLKYLYAFWLLLRHPRLILLLC